MKIIFFTLFVAMLISSFALAAPFSPTLLKLSANPIIQYDFDGSQLSIPLQVSGKSAGVIFCVFTEDKANQIVNIRNGNIGWHHVNKVDTCIFYSTIKDVGVGSNTITWDGKDQDGGVVAAGEYTYYMWAFDNQGAKEVMVAHLNPTQNGRMNYVHEIQEVDEQGLPLANPILFRRDMRWRIGNDPYDSLFTETSTQVFAEGWRSSAGDACFQPDDFNYQYVYVQNRTSLHQSIQKFKWVPFGECEVQDDWGDNGYAEMFFTTGAGDQPGVKTDGTYIFTGVQAHTGTNEPIAGFFVYDMDGTMIKEVDLTPWWSDADDLAAGAQMNGGPTNFCLRNGMITMSCHCSCIDQMVDPLRYLETDEVSDFFVWTNLNGDYILDRNFEETSVRPWVCNDYSVGPYKYGCSTDDKLFTAVNAYDVGAVTFGLYAPDGTGLGYFAVAGETAGWKKGQMFLDGETPFDGLYCDNQSQGGPLYEYDSEKAGRGFYFLGHDAISGVITTVVGVEEAPVAFSVAQNSPNPFNPSTTITFNLAQAGNVSIDVYNVSAQKVDTLVNGFMDAGSHSVVWNASDFSAGVYFYTVKSGGSSRTMKMTLLK